MIDALNWITSLHVSTYLDIGLMALLIYVLLMWFKNTRALFVFIGILIFGLFYIAVQILGLVMMNAVLEKFFTVILVALVVIFQEELRGFFERLALWSFDPAAARRKDMRLSREEVEIIARSLQDLARKRIGALIILKGKTSIARHCDGGIPLNGRLSEQLVMSLFDPTSIGHDGAAIIEGGKITEFSCMLPLSKNLSKIKGAGTRHAAALGLSELSDALCIVVSEERGTISIARNGELETIVDPSRLTYILSRFYQETYPSREGKALRFRIFANLKEKIFALALSLTLWVVLVQGKIEETRSFNVPVAVKGIANPWRLDYVEPTNVIMTVTGPKSAFLLLRPNNLNVSVTATNQTGMQLIGNTYFTNNLPDSLNLESYNVNEVRVRLVNPNETNANNATGSR